MSANASDLFRIAVAFMGFEPFALVKAIHRIHSGSRVVNSRTVERAIGDLAKLYREQQGGHDAVR